MSKVDEYRYRWHKITGLASDYLPELLMSGWTVDVRDINEPATKTDDDGIVLVRLRKLVTNGRRFHSKTQNIS